MNHDRPLRFACRQHISLPPEEILKLIFDLKRWPEFRGYGPLPGIRSAEYETQPPQRLGTRIRVTNRDGSTHVEEVIEWQPPGRLRMRLRDFSAPLSHLASEFQETWDLEQRERGTLVVRTFELAPRSWLARPALWLISRLLRRAIARHLQDIQTAADGEGR